MRVQDWNRQERSRKRTRSRAAPGPAPLARVQDDGMVGPRFLLPRGQDTTDRALPSEPKTATGGSLSGALWNCKDILFSLFSFLERFECVSMHQVCRLLHAHVVAYKASAWRRPPPPPAVARKPDHSLPLIDCDEWQALVNATPGRDASQMVQALCAISNSRLSDGAYLKSFVLACCVPRRSDRTPRLSWSALLEFVQNHLRDFPSAAYPQAVDRLFSHQLNVAHLTNHLAVLGDSYVDGTWDQGLHEDEIEPILMLQPRGLAVTVLNKHLLARLRKVGIHDISTLCATNGPDQWEEETGWIPKKYAARCEEQKAERLQWTSGSTPDAGEIEVVLGMLDKIVASVRRDQSEVRKRRRAVSSTLQNWARSSEQKLVFRRLRKWLHVPCVNRDDIRLSSKKWLLEAHELRLLLADRLDLDICAQLEFVERRTDLILVGPVFRRNPATLQGALSFVLEWNKEEVDPRFEDGFQWPAAGDLQVVQDLFLGWGGWSKSDWWKALRHRHTAKCRKSYPLYRDCLCPNRHYQLLESANELRVGDHVEECQTNWLSTTVNRHETLAWMALYWSHGVRRAPSPALVSIVRRFCPVPATPAELLQTVRDGNGRLYMGLPFLVSSLEEHIVIRAVEMWDTHRRRIGRFCIGSSSAEGKIESWLAFLHELRYMEHTTPTQRLDRIEGLLQSWDRLAPFWEAMPHERKLCKKRWNELAGSGWRDVFGESNEHPHVPFAIVWILHLWKPSLYVNLVEQYELHFEADPPSVAETKEFIAYCKHLGSYVDWWNPSAVDSHFRTCTLATWKAAPAEYKTSGRCADGVQR